MARLIVFYAVFAAWVVMWGWFLVREVFVKGAIKDYKVLISRPLEGRRAYVTKDNLYEFLTFCRENLPRDSSYSLVGPEPGAIERVRAVYYLYPRIESTDPQYILVYGTPGVGHEGYRLIKKLDDSRYMLKKIEG
ncbi:MAG: hypothetical protein WC522_00515 [Candidatus Omnitrophota bacterium]